MLLAALCLLTISCQKEEVTNFNMETEFPETVELIEATFNASVTDVDGNAVPGARIDVYVDGSKILTDIGSGSDTNFNIENESFHPTRTVIKVSASGFTPNFATPNFEEGESVNLNFVMDVHEHNSMHSMAEVAEHNNENHLSVSINPDVISSETSYLLVSQTYDFGFQTTDLMHADRTIDPGGNVSTIEFKEIFYVGAYNELGQQLSVNEESAFNVNVISDVTDPSVYVFNQKLGIWLPMNNVDLTENGFNFSADQLTVYGVISSCSGDTKAPTPYCFVGSTYTLNDDNIVIAEFFDAGSFDDCDEDLTFLVRRVQDDCGVGAENFGDSFTICPEDEGKTIEVEMKIIDDSRNSDYCITSFEVVSGAGNPNAPIPICLNISTVLYSTGVMLWAQDFDNGSYDVETAQEDLTFEIRKMTDACANGSDTFGPTIEICAAEQGTTIGILMKVIDEDGNSNTCAIDLKVI